MFSKAIESAAGRIQLICWQNEANFFQPFAAKPAYSCCPTRRRGALRKTANPSDPAVASSIGPSAPTPTAVDRPRLLLDLLPSNETA